MIPVGSIWWLRFSTPAIFEVSSREFHTIGGTYKGKPIMCLSHGIGPDNIDIVVTELDALANVDFATREVRENPVVRLPWCV